MSKVELTKIKKNHYGDIMPLVKFTDYVNSNCFIDYDGYGLPVTNDQNFLVDYMVIKPSQLSEYKAYLKRHNLSDLLTHVIWYNK